MTLKDTILTEINGKIAMVWLNRPQKHNAIDSQMISGLLSILSQLNSDPELRLICIRGKGPSFSAGADYEWMRNASEITDSENVEQCRSLARCYYELYNSKKITVCMVHGSCFGGANGFVAAADLALADETCIFGFPEVRSGLIPATVSPYLLKKMAQNHVTELMLSGRRFNAQEALKLGLVNAILPSARFNESAQSWLENLQEGAPLAQSEIKQFIRTISSKPLNEELLNFTAETLARVRVSEEANEGINSFFEKRKPEWSVFLHTRDNEKHV